MNNCAKTSLMKYYDTFVLQNKIIQQCIFRFYIMQKYHKVVIFLM